jgi:hypothetical protein
MLFCRTYWSKDNKQIMLKDNSELCSNKTPNQMHQSIVKFIALSHRCCSTCFRHYHTHHQEPFQTAVAASGFHMNEEVDVFPAMVSLLQTDHGWKHVQRLCDKAINFTIDRCIWLDVLFECLRMHGNTNPKFRTMSLHISLHIWRLFCIVDHSKSSFTLLAARIWHIWQTMQSLSTSIIADHNWCFLL